MNTKVIGDNQPVEMPSESEIESWRCAADSLLAAGTVHNTQRMAAMRLQDAYLFVREAEKAVVFQVLVPGVSGRAWLDCEEQQFRQYPKNQRRKLILIKE